MYILGARNVVAPSPRRRRSLCELVRFDAVLCAKEAEDASKQYTCTYAIAMDFDAAISRKRPQSSLHYQYSYAEITQRMAEFRVVVSICDESARDDDGRRSSR
ncbi:unnamed protein product [Sphagnum troendelagicum]|uniref:Uncharacterized protein n=1 Tax=Sphagnum troendelagicum TaxID=128251 RepID=A0ABP0TIT3_9BRYO